MYFFVADLRECCYATQPTSMWLRTRKRARRDPPAEELLTVPFLGVFMAISLTPVALSVHFDGTCLVPGAWYARYALSLLSNAVGRGRYQLLEVC